MTARIALCTFALALTIIGCGEDSAPSEDSTSSAGTDSASNGVDSGAVMVNPTGGSSVDCLTYCESFFECVPGFTTDALSQCFAQCSGRVDHSAECNGANNEMMLCVVQLDGCDQVQQFFDSGESGPPCAAEAGATAAACAG